MLATETTLDSRHLTSVRRLLDSILLPLDSGCHVKLLSQLPTVFKIPCTSKGSEGLSIQAAFSDQIKKSKIGTCHKMAHDIQRPMPFQVFYHQSYLLQAYKSRSLAYSAVLLNFTSSQCLAIQQENLTAHKYIGSDLAS